jgi:hypothetical protein
MPSSIPFIIYSVITDYKQLLQSWHWSDMLVLWGAKKQSIHIYDWDYYFRWYRPWTWPTPP